MPDLQQFSITPLSSVNVSLPRAQVSCLVTHSQTGAPLADFTGANAVVFPQILSTLTAAERLELVQMIAGWLLQKKRPDLWA